MTEVSFHTGVTDKLAFACRLLRKAQRLGARIVVAGPAPLLQQLDRALWTFDPLDFVPHLLVPSGAAPAPRLQGTPVWLVERTQDAPHHEVLLNLDDEVCEGFESFGRVIELVSNEIQDRQAGRLRWKHYAERGYPVLHHEAAPR